jgi:hypothetical protein
MKLHLCNFFFNLLNKVLDNYKLVDNGSTIVIKYLNINIYIIY